MPGFGYHYLSDGFSTHTQTSSVQRASDLPSSFPQKTCAIHALAFIIMFDQMGGGDGSFQVNSKVKAIIGALIIVLIGLLLTPTVVTQVNNLTGGTPGEAGAGALAGDTTGAKEIVNLINIFWVLGVLGGAVGFIYVQFRGQGGM